MVNLVCEAILPDCPMKDVEEIEKFGNLEDLTKEFLKGFKLLMPFYLKTKEI